MAEQFQYNSDFPALPPKEPVDFPPAEPHPCARITTRVFHPSRNEITTVQNVLVRTMLPPIAVHGTTSRMVEDDEDDDDDEVYSSSSSESDSDFDSEMIDDGNVPAAATAASSTNGANGGGEVERAYWMQRTIREAIYGRVLFGIVLQKQPNGIWQVTTERCAIKEMSWQHIRKERDRLAEDPIKEVSAMEYLKNWYIQNKQQQKQQQQQQQQIQQSSSAAAPSSSSSSSMGVPSNLPLQLQQRQDPFEAMADTSIMMPMDLLSDDTYLYSVMPFCDGGELFERLDMNERFTEEEARYWMLQVVNGLEHLQRAGICHRDMSLENLLVHQNGCLIIDMGMCLRIPYASDAGTLSSSMENMNLTNGNNSNGATQSQVLLINGQQSPRHLISPQGTCGKWIYMSPEIYKNSDPFDGFAVDVWAAGVILFLMLTGFPPWERACNTDERFRYMTAGYLVQMLTEWELGLSSDAMDLLQRMLWLDPKDRLSLHQVRAHPWMIKGTITAPR